MSDTTDENKNEGAELQLDFYQNFGTKQLDFTLDQAMDPNFGEHTIRGADSLVHSGKVESLSEAATLLSGLDAIKTRAIVNLDLNTEEVQVPNFGTHTIAGIQGLVNDGRAEDNKEAYETLKELNEIQVFGVLELNFERAQVLAPNFGEHTIVGSVALMRNGSAKNNKEALSIIQDFDAAQTHGYVFDNLTADQVIAPTFGLHTILAMETLQEQGRANSSSEAYGMVENLDASQASFFVGLPIAQEQLPDASSETTKAQKLPNPVAKGQANGSDITNNDKENSKFLQEFIKPQTGGKSKGDTRKSLKNKKNNTGKKPKKPRL